MCSSSGSTPTRGPTPPRCSTTESSIGELGSSRTVDNASGCCEFAAPFTPRTWAIEAAGGLGALLAQQLVEAGETVVDVPPTLSARARLLDAGRTDKTDPHDARSAAIVALRHARLRQVRPVDHTAVLRLLADRHHDLTGLRTQAICRLHALPCGLTPGGAGRLLSAIVDLFTYDLHFGRVDSRADERRFADDGAEWRYGDLPRQDR